MPPATVIHVSDGACVARARRIASDGRMLSTPCATTSPSRMVLASATAINSGGPTRISLGIDATQIVPQTIVRSGGPGVVLDTGRIHVVVGHATAGKRAIREQCD